MKLLDLKTDQRIIIENVDYRVLNRVKFSEKSSYWIEYKLQNTNGEIFYLNVEISGKSILYQILQNKKIDLKLNINFEGEEFEIFEKGIGKVETYSGMTDVALNEEASYYEYTSKVDRNKILSIEKWKDETEISIGRIIDIKRIKIIK